MKIKPMPFSGRDGPFLPATKPPFSVTRSILLLLAFITALMLGAGLLYSGKRLSLPAPGGASGHQAPLAPAITGKSAAALEAELVHVQQELMQAQAEREATRKAIEQVSRELEQKLKQAGLAE